MRGIGYCTLHFLTGSCCDLCFSMIAIMCSSYFVVLAELRFSLLSCLIVSAYLHEIIKDEVRLPHRIKLNCYTKIVLDKNYRKEQLSTKTNITYHLKFQSSDYC